MKITITRSLTALMLFSLLVSACGRLGGDDYATSQASDDFYFEEAGAPEAVFAGEMAADADFAADEAEARLSSEAQSVERLVIKNADISVVVDQPSQAMEAISKLAEEMGGFVVHSNVYQTTTAGGLEVPSASLTIRVPSERLQEALDAIEGQAVRVVAQSQSGQDVTSQYTDLQSRLRNLEDAEALLREIMEAAEDTEDVLNAFHQLNGITEQIEVLKGQIQYYEESAALSAISVQLIASAADQPISIGGWEPVGVAKDAIQALVNALQGVVNALIWIALYVLPVALVIGIPLWLIVRALRRRWAARRKVE